MGKYEGLDPKLKQAVFDRDNYRCRWCGRPRSSWGFDAHHIVYRRGAGDDLLGNLVTLCRDCHNFVHDSSRIPKQTAQAILFDLTETPGITGLARLRQVRAEEKRLNEVSRESGPGPGRLL